MSVSGVVGLGALNIDRITFVDKIPSSDEEGYVRSVQLHPGGSAPNTIVGLSRLGVRAACIGKVGSDPEGQAMIKSLRAERVDVGGILVVRGRTGTASVLVDEDGGRAILIDPGVNDEISFEDLDIDYLKTFGLIHMTSFVCRSQQTSFNTQASVAERAGVPVSLDPGQLYAERGLQGLLRILRRVKIFLPNERELRLMTGMGRRRGARKILGKGVKIVAVKRGHKGCFVTDGRIEADVPAYGGRGVDTTGAGDAFNAGFLYGILRGMDPVQSAEFGVKVAWLSIQKPGARDGLPTLEELASLA